jgi:hypothetical protein
MKDYVDSTCNPCRTCNMWLICTCSTQHTLHNSYRHLLLHFTASSKWVYKMLYWCVAYLPSEASIIEHWTLHPILS